MSVDEVSQDFLRSVISNGGSATTTEIREDTGMTKGRVQYRFDKLSDMGWIEIERAEEGLGDRTPPKVAVLTEEGENAINSGKAGERVLKDDIDENSEITVSEEQIEEFKTEVDKMKNRLNVVTTKVNEGGAADGDVEYVTQEEFESLKVEVGKLSDTVKLLNSTLKDLREEVESGEIGDGGASLDDEEVQRIRDKQDYLEEWMDVAQVHINAIQMLMEDKDEDYEFYLDRASENMS